MEECLAAWDVGVDAARHPKVVVVPDSGASPVEGPGFGAYPPVEGQGFVADPPIGAPGFGAVPPVGAPGFGVYPPVGAPDFDAYQPVEGLGFVADPFIEGLGFVADPSIEGLGFVADPSLEGLGFVADPSIEGLGFVADPSIEGLDFVADPSLEGMGFVADPSIEGPGFGAVPPVGASGFGVYPPVGAPGFGAYPPPVATPSVDPLYGYFAAVAGADQQIDQKELQHCLTSSGFAGTYQPFSIETCTLMINMLDRDYSGKMGFNEFKELWTVLNQWKQTFMTYDRDRSGQIDGNELAAAFGAFGYRLSPQAIGALVRRYGVANQIPFDAFVACAVRLRGLTDFFRRKDVQQLGNATMAYDDFITGTMSF
ncbi:sorcin isoform X1 [Strongylocentrotus purpuratus]|uniref:EF-hand domain-containing protein n=1 Tax=Strongylocentrotus purpuratus TaxID=7668 RepID=A0A7M7HN58_STRPU|nr:sorcin isoform X1 [Strongylocentrotus purpuratus]